MGKSRSPKPGPTGRFPEGKIDPSDEGELAVAIGIRDGKVVVDFGPKPVSWFAFDAQLARRFANAIVARAEEIENG